MALTFIGRLSGCLRPGVAVHDLSAATTTNFDHIKQASKTLKTLLEKKRRNEDVNLEALVILFTGAMDEITKTLERAKRSRGEYDEKSWCGISPAIVNHSLYSIGAEVSGALGIASATVSTFEASKTSGPTPYLGWALLVSAAAALSLQARTRKREIDILRLDTIIERNSTCFIIADATRAAMMRVNNQSEEPLDMDQLHKEISAIPKLPGYPQIETKDLTEVLDHVHHSKSRKTPGTMTRQLSERKSHTPPSTQDVESVKFHIDEQI